MRNVGGGGAADPSVKILTVGTWGKCTTAGVGPGCVSDQVLAGGCGMPADSVSGTQAHDVFVDSEQGTPI